MTTQGPLGNKQVRVEDWVTLTPAGDVGTSAANTVQVTSSAIDGTYFIFSQPEPLPQESNNSVLCWHVWYDVSGSAIDPLPRECNQPGIRVIAASGTVVNALAAATASTIIAYFAATPNPPAFVRASATTDTITIINASAGPARVQDGVGSRDGVDAFTGWTFASSIPGVLPATVTFTIASTIEAPGSLGASIQQLIPHITDNLIASSYNVAFDSEITRITMPTDATGMPASVAAAAYWLLWGPVPDQYHVWYSVAGLATEPVASGTGVEVNGVASADLAASLAVKTASSINALADFSATASADVVLITIAASGSDGPPDATDFDAGVSVSVIQQGGGDFNIDRSNQFPNPDFDPSGT